MTDGPRCAVRGVLLAGMARVGCMDGSGLVWYYIVPCAGLEDLLIELLYYINIAIKKSCSFITFLLHFTLIIFIPFLLLVSKSFQD